ncbi:hypothetical protein FRC18_003300 [Serendipita sp. 400]|nr:hypothetical protein FRC18_003300 [Serendipita sp. 400]
MRPLPDTHPELEIIDNLPIFVEYRVYNIKISEDGSQRRLYGYSIKDLVLLGIIWFIWKHYQSPFVVGIILLLLLRGKTTLLLWESVIVLPSLGLQVEVTRGFCLPWTKRIWPLSTSRKFIPLNDIHDVLINEGLRRWSWYYYLAILRRKGEPRNQTAIELSFEDTLPPLAVVREIYHGVREILFEEYTG